MSERAEYKCDELLPLLLFVIEIQVNKLHFEESTIVVIIGGSSTRAVWKSLRNT